MRVAVIAYLVSLGERASDDIGIVSGVLAKHEECRVYACFIKHIQQVGGKRGRAIVESNSAEIFRHGLGAELEGAIEIAFGWAVRQQGPKEGPRVSSRQIRFLKCRPDISPPETKMSPLSLSLRGTGRKIWRPAGSREIILRENSIFC